MIRTSARWTKWALVAGIFATATPGLSAQQKGKAAGKAGGATTGKGFESAVPAGKWIGQDGKDLVGAAAGVGPSEVQDIHIALVGLPPRAKITFAKINPLGGGEWVYKGAPGPWAAEIVREEGSRRADLYLEPHQAETGRAFQVLLQFDDGKKAEFFVKGGKADPNLRMAGAAMTAKWVGQEKVDRVGVGPSVGPDGFMDAKIGLEQLSKTGEITGVTVSGPGGMTWESGVNPKGHASAELVRDGADPTKGELFLGCDRDLQGQSLTVAVSYKDGKTDTARIVAGKVDPRAKVARVVAPVVGTVQVTSRWIGQDGSHEVGAGDVHVALDGLPKAKIVAAALSDPSRGLWTVKFGDKPPFDAGPWALPMALKRGASPEHADLYFPPFRDESGGTMTLRLLMEDGKTVVATFPGGPADPGLRASVLPDKASTTAKPGDDLNELAKKFGAIRLAAGRHLMSKPLVLEKPVTITGDAGASIVFSQGAADPTWTAAIKIRDSHTTLEGFAVRFATPIRWSAGIEGGPAVIGVTDNLDTVPKGFQADLNFRKLDLEGPPASGTWDEAPRLLRMGHAACGKIEGNILKGGATDLVGGPWRFVGNTYLGTLPKTYCFGVVSVQHPHDLVVKDNTSRPTGPTGKAWRFLVLTQSGNDDLVEGNTIGGIGPRDDDTVPGVNAPETILTESYALHFEGKPSALSPDGRVLVLPLVQGGPAVTGDVVSILSGPEAGQWRRIAQAMGPTTYLMDSPLPAGDYAVSISTGFVRETFRRNTIDCRGSSVAADLMLVGNHFGLKVVGNHILGANAFLITAAPTEQPVHWGWSHAPMMGATIEGNLIEDALLGTVSVEHSAAVKTSRGRVYASVILRNNTVRWTEAFAAKQAAGGKKRRPMIVVGHAEALDPAELHVTEEGNRAEARLPIEIGVHAAKLNGKEVRDRRISLPAAPASASASPERKGKPRT